MLLQETIRDEELARLFVIMGALQFSEKGFDLKVHRDHPDWNLPKSPYYLNFGVKPNGPLEEWQAHFLGQVLGRWFWTHLTPEDMQGVQIAGIPKTGIALAEGVFEVWKTFSDPPIRLLELFHKDKKIVIASKIGGDFRRKRPLALIDDVISDGETKHEAIEASILKVNRIVVLLDRMQGGVERFTNRGIQVLYKMTMNGLLNCCLNSGFVSSDIYASCIEYPKKLGEATIKAKLEDQRRKQQQQQQLADLRASG